MADITLQDNDGDNITLTTTSQPAIVLQDNDSDTIAITSRVDGENGSDGIDGTDGYNPLTVSATEPENPQLGDIWYQP